MLSQRKLLPIFAAVLWMLTGCATTAQTNKISDKETQHLTNIRADDYFYRYNATIATLLKKQHRTPVEQFEIGEYYALLGQPKTALSFLVTAAEHGNDTVMLAALTTIKTLPAFPQSIKRLSHLRCHGTNPIASRQCTIIRAKAALKAGNISRARDSISMLNGPVSLSLFSFSALTNTDSFIHRYQSGTLPDSGRTVTLAPLPGTADLSDYMETERGNTAFLYGEWVVHKTGTFYLSVYAPKQWILFIDGSRYNLDHTRDIAGFTTIPITAEAGKHTVLLRCTPTRHASKVSLYLQEDIPTTSPPIFRHTISKRTQNTHPASFISPLVLPPVHTPMEHYLRLRTKSFYQSSWNNTQWESLYESVIGSDNPALLSTIADSYRHTNHLKDALKIYRMLSGRYPALASVQAAYADLLRTVGLFDEVRTLLFTGSQSPSLPLLTARFDYAESLDQTAVASNVLKQLTTLFPDYTATADRQARYALMKDNIEQAFNIRLAAAFQRPGDISRTASLLLDLIKARRWNNIQKLLEHTIPLFPYDIGFHFFYAKALYTLGKTSRAKEEFLTLYRQKPDDEQVLLYMGDLHAEAGNNIEAGKWYRRAMHAAPDSTAVFNRIEQLPDNVPLTVLSREFLPDFVASSADTKPCPVKGGHVLLDEGVQYISENLNVRSVYRLIVRIESTEAVNNYTTIPFSGILLSAKVIGADGKNKPIIQSRTSFSCFNLAIGDTVEYVVAEFSRPERFITGFNFSWLFGQRGQCVDISRLVVLSPRILPLRFHLSGEGITQQNDTEENLVKHVFTAKNTVYHKDEELLAPPFREAVKQLHISPIISWNTVAADAYSRWHLQPPDAGIKKKAADLDRGNGARDFATNAFFFTIEQIATIQTNDTFFDAPQTPTQTLKKKSGTIRDKTMLLKSLLDARGISSSFVLVNAENNSLFRQAPSNRFDTVLLFVDSQPGINKPLFLDLSLPNGIPGLINPSREGTEGLLLDETAHSWRFQKLLSSVPSGISIAETENNRYTITFFGHYAQIVRQNGGLKEVARLLSLLHGSSVPKRNITFTSKSMQTDPLTYTASIQHFYPKFTNLIASQEEVDAIWDYWRFYPLSIRNKYGIFTATIKGTLPPETKTFDRGVLLKLVLRQGNKEGETSVTLQLTGALLPTDDVYDFFSALDDIKSEEASAEELLWSKRF